MPIEPRVRRLAIPVAALLLCGLQALTFGAAPPEVQNLQLPDASTLTWDAASGAAEYHVYRGDAGELGRGIPLRCHGARVATTSFTSAGVPSPGAAFAMLVTADSATDEEGTPGAASGGQPRALLGRCEPVIENQILGRIGYGRSEWQVDRLQTLGWQGYVDEQLAPETIDQSGNTLLNQREPRWATPNDLQELVYLRMERDLYSWAQLERELTGFWQNHFTTYYFKTFEYLAAPLLGNGEKALRNAADVHLREEDSLRDLALNGTVRDIVEASTLSAAMMIYLDNVVNVVGRPNENYARELVELHTMGVDCGYNETDVRELARVFTGWEVCKKSFSDANDPLAPCTDPNFGVAGKWVANFNSANHDGGQKTIFQGTAYETVIPDTSANPAAGADDVGIALDAIVAHPCTKQFLSRKLLSHFITDQPTQQMVDAVVVDWDASGGDLREITRSVLRAEWLFDPDFAGSKLKTPQQHELSAYRVLRGKTDPLFNNPLLYNWMAALGHLPYNRVSPDGYPDTGAAWIGTNQLLSRQDMGLGFAYDVGFYRTEITQIVTENGLSTASEIVDHFAGLLFGGALSPADRQRAIDYLETDATGVPSPYDDNRIRETVGFMLGFSSFNER